MPEAPDTSRLDSVPAVLIPTAESRSFQLLLEAQAEPAIDRVLKRRLQSLLWAAAAVGAVASGLGLQAYCDVKRAEERLDKVATRADEKAKIAEDALKQANTTLALVEGAVAL